MVAISPIPLHSSVIALLASFYLSKSYKDLDLVLPIQTGTLAYYIPLSVLVVGHSFFPSTYYAHLINPQYLSCAKPSVVCLFLYHCLVSSLLLLLLVWLLKVSVCYQPVLVSELSQYQTDSADLPSPSVHHW